MEHPHHFRPNQGFNIVPQRCRRRRCNKSLYCGKGTRLEWSGCALTHSLLACEGSGRWTDCGVRSADCGVRTVELPNRKKQLEKAAAPAPGGGRGVAQRRQCHHCYSAKASEREREGGREGFSLNSSSNFSHVQSQIAICSGRKEGLKASRRWIFHIVLRLRS